MRGNRDGALVLMVTIFLVHVAFVTMAVGIVAAAWLCLGVAVLASLLLLVAAAVAVVEGMNSSKQQAS
jgi:hypothetical protein